MPDQAALTAATGRVERARAAIRVALEDASRIDPAWITGIRGSRDWAMAPDALEFLGKLVYRVRPRHIVEFGSGVSTRVIDRACQHFTRSCRISCIENDPQYMIETAAGVSERVALQLAPLVVRRPHHKSLPAYHLDPALLASTRRADLVLVDGPPGVLGGREGVLYQALALSRVGTIILLDDASRSQEAEAIEAWQDLLDDAIEVNVLPGFQKGLASIIVHDPRPVVKERRQGIMDGAAAPERRHD